MPNSRPKIFVEFPFWRHFLCNFHGISGSSKSTLSIKKARSYIIPALRRHLKLKSIRFYNIEKNLYPTNKAESQKNQNFWYN